MLKILQTWFHISDRIKNKGGEGRYVKQVSDLATDESKFYMELPKSFVELRVFGRNSNDEFAFLDKNGHFYANFGNLKRFPGFKDEDDEIRHLKIQVEYIITKPKFDRYRITTGYDTSYKFEGPIQPEFSISVSKGLNIKKHDYGYLDVILTQKSEIQIGFLQDSEFEISNEIYDPYELKEREIYSNENESSLEDISYYRIIENFEDYDSESSYSINLGLKTKEELLEISNPYIKHDSKGEIYNFIIRRESYDKIVKSPQKCRIKIEIGYTVKNKWYFLSFPILGFSLFFVLFIYLLFTNFDKFSVTVPLSFLIVAISYTGLFSTLSVLESYEIPYYRVVLIEIIAIFILIVSIFVVSILFADIGSLEGQTIYTMLNYIYNNLNFNLVLNPFSTIVNYLLGMQIN